MNLPSPLRLRRAFTLVELLVSMAILAVLMLILLSAMGTVQRTWISSTAKIEQFRNARQGFEAMTRKMSQATLNTYWDYNQISAPTNFVRQSELRFITGQARTLTGLTSTTTHSVFFVAPLGYAADTTYQSLGNLLNTCGYYVEYADDRDSRPAFITSSVVPYRNRFRLMEMVGPSESMPIYKYTSGIAADGTTPRCSTYVGKEWFTDILNTTPRPSRVVSENVLALVLLPKLSPIDEKQLISDGVLSSSLGTNLAPSYSYDSTAKNAKAAINPRNQLPPVVMVTMVAVDEASFSNYLSRMGSSSNPITDLGLESLFQTAGDLTDPNNAGYARDLVTLQNTLASRQISYRVFSTDVSLKVAKWSREQAN